MKHLVCRSGYIVSNLEADDLTAEKAKNKKILKWEKKKLKWEKKKLFALEILRLLPRNEKYIKELTKHTEFFDMIANALLSRIHNKEF